MWEGREFGSQLGQTNELQKLYLSVPSLVLCISKLGKEGTGQLNIVVIRLSGIWDQYHDLLGVIVTLISCYEFVLS